MAKEMKSDIQLLLYKKLKKYNPPPLYVFLGSQEPKHLARYIVEVFSLVGNENT